ncbi:hypothetical protein Droror1_Dr00001553 [Drosera rotundifolia]
MARHNSSYTENLSPPPPQLCFFFVVLVLILGFSWYIKREPVLDDDLFLQLRLLVLVVPVVLVLAVHWLSAEERHTVPLLSQDYIHRAGGSPWGVAVLLVLLFMMISYHAAIQEKWFPLLSKLI